MKDPQQDQERPIEAQGNPVVDKADPNKDHRAKWSVVAGDFSNFIVPFSNTRVGQTKPALTASA